MAGVVNATSGIDRDNDEGSSAIREPTKGNRPCRTLMYKAAMRGDWKYAESLLQIESNLARLKISDNGETALHIAAAMKHTKFVRKLVKHWMDANDLLERNNYGQTAFCYAAVSGVVDIAAAMRKTDGLFNELVNIHYENGLSPIYIAAQLGNKDMVSYLFRFANFQNLTAEKWEEWFDILQATVSNRMYDVALTILTQNGSLATMTYKETTMEDEDKEGTTVVERETTKERTTVADEEKTTVVEKEKTMERTTVADKEKTTVVDKEKTNEGTRVADEEETTVVETEKTKERVTVTDKEETTVVEKEKTILHMLVGQEMSDINAFGEAILQRLVTVFATVPFLSWLKRKFEQPLMRKRARSLAEKLWAEIQRLDLNDDVRKLINDPPILHEAAKAGNVGFITMLTQSDPNLIWQKDENKHTIFHVAVLHRQENVFSLFRQIGSMKKLIAITPDKNNNNILHLAGEVAPSNRSKMVAGAALQMQRELMWFKEVEKIVPHRCLTMKNSDGFLPRELFSEKHQDLLKEGEKWMRDTANSCTLMATLIATVAFAAAFTVPGGNNDETGSPKFIKKSWFTVFVVSDTVAMFSSTSSIIMFLSILTSRFQEDDFLVSLPTKLLFGVTALFASIVGTILAFTATCYLVFTEERAWLPKWAIAFACFLVIIQFGVLHFRLWFDTIWSICWSTFLFHPGKHTIC